MKICKNCKHWNQIGEYSMADVGRCKKLGPYGKDGEMKTANNFGCVFFEWKKEEQQKNELRFL